IRARGQTPAPGYHAHLGMLYAQIGRSDQVAQRFQTEAELFPESRPYMEFLLKRKIQEVGPGNGCTGWARGAWAGCRVAAPGRARSGAAPAPPGGGVPRRRS